jgi:predicted metal-binding membrane protein
MNSGISDKAKIQQAYNFIYNRTAEDMRNKGEGEPILYSILFLLGYLDAHISFGLLSEKKADEIMAYLSEHYNISYEP